MLQEKKKWKPFFIPPDLYELCKDYILNKGEEEHIFSPRVLGIKSVEEFLRKRGYGPQVQEIQDDFQKKLMPRAPILSLDRLDEHQREAVILLMDWRKMNQQEAIRWVLNNPDKLEEAIQTER